MKPLPSPESDEQDRKLIKLLKGLSSFESAYPPPLLAARRAAFLAHVDELRTADVEEELSAGDQEVVRLLGYLKSAQANYPSDLLAARRSALLQQAGLAAEKTGPISGLRTSIRRIFQPRTTIQPVPDFMRVSLVIGSLLVIALIGSLLLSRVQPPGEPSASAGAVGSSRLLAAGPREVALRICKPGDETPLCSPRAFSPGQDLAYQGNGLARPAVSKDARPTSDSGAHRAAYVNDGRGGDSWVSNSADSWIKIDLGRVATINTVSLQKGRPVSSTDNNPGQFVIAVALSDVYADGDSSNDYIEYAQVFNSEQTGFSGTVSPAETIRTRFAPIRARFVKITFEKAGAAIEEVGVFMVQPPVPTERPTRRPQDDVPAIPLTATSTSTLRPLDTATSVPTNTPLPTETAVALPSNTARPSDTPTPLPTNTQLPADTATPIPTDPLPSDTPLPSPTAVLPTAIPPTVIRPTEIPPSVQTAPASTDTIVVTGNEQSLTFTCNGNAAEIRGHANTVTLLGSCSSITVTGNGNRVFWQFGSPIITNRGNENIISQR